MPPPARINRLAANALAATVMLLIQTSFGIAVGLYSILPAGDHGKGPLPAFGSAVADGPLLLSLHAVLGTLLLVTAVAAVVRALRVGGRSLIALAAAGLAAIVLAWVAGSRFVGNLDRGAALTMAIATAAALLAYTLIIFIARGRS
jgi:hypothetical protein